MKKPDFTIRKMTYQDLDQVCRGEEESFSTPWSRVSIESELRMRDEDPSLREILVLEDGASGDIAGHACIFVVCGEATVNDIAIYPEYRGRGYGKTLLSALMAAGEGLGATSYTLEVRSSNEVAIAMYESAGFERTALRKDYYQNPTEDALILWLKR